MEKFAIIVAGGSGSRMGTTVPKQFLLLGDRPVLWHTINAFLQAFADMNIVVTLPSKHMEEGGRIIQMCAAPQRVSSTEGGDTRFSSVKNGLKKVPDGCMVFVHDGVRCLVSPELIQRCFREALLHRNAIPAVAPADSVRIQSTEGNYMVDRNTVKMIQTPQTFYSDDLKRAFLQPFDEAFTDEASVVERSGRKIHLIEGDPLNIKITRKADLVLAGTIMSGNV